MDLEHKMMHDSTHDLLTGLPNRSLLLDRMQQAIVVAHRSDQPLALLVIDLDHFKEVNDTLGHYQGDLLLKQVGLRLQNTLFPSDTIARLGGDEFAIFLSSLNEGKDVKVILAKIKKVFASPFVLKKDMPLNIKCSIGVSLYPEHGRDVDTLMQRADIAMYVAKSSQRDYLVYSPKFDQHSSERLTLMAELSQAIENDDLVIYFQPKICCHTMRMCGVEVLVRWQHEKLGLIPPDQFIPMAERTGLIGSLTTWVLKETFQSLEKWHKQGLEIKASVNIAVQTLLDPEFPETLTGLLASVALPKDSLTLEITETSVMKDPDLALSVLFRLRDMGISISIDDFGTGYSSLAYLREMPVSEVKIDKSFVLEMLNKEEDAVIVKAIIDLAHNLKLKVVAEGVETKEVLRELNSLGCDLLQGYFFSRPVPFDEFGQWFMKFKKARAKKEKKD
jgi:diguanylate cyclase (GGDEF)-like protein